MKTILVAETFNREGKLVDRREQVSRSYTTDFARLLYTQQAQVSTYNSPSATNFGVAAGAGALAYGYAHGDCYGIVVGRGSTAVVAGDTQLEYPIGHGRTYKALHPKLTNPSFETGDFTGWATSGSPTIIEGGFPGATGRYVWGVLGIIGTHYLTQSLDFTNVTAIKVAYSIYYSTITVLYDAVIIWTESIASPQTIVRTVVIPVSTSGVKTLKLQFSSGTILQSTMCDTVEVWGTLFEIGACECTYPTFSAPNGEMTLRRYFYNRSGSSVTVNEVGIVVFPGRFILRDLVSPGVPVNDGDTLRVTYQIQVTA